MAYDMANMEEGFSPAETKLRGLTAERVYSRRILVTAEEFTVSWPPTILEYHALTSANPEQSFPSTPDALSRRQSPICGCYGGPSFFTAATPHRCNGLMNLGEGGGARARSFIPIPEEVEINDRRELRGRIPGHSKSAAAQ